MRKGAAGIVRKPGPPPWISLSSPGEAVERAVVEESGLNRHGAAQQAAGGGEMGAPRWMTGAAAERRVGGEGEPGGDDAGVNSIQTLKPDMIVVLGDISAKGSEVTERKWISVIEQFEGILGHHSSLPLLTVLGDKDVGNCANLEGKFVHCRAKHLPGLDSCGRGAFEISNVSFVSLNAVVLMCGNNDLQFGVEKFMEREIHHFQSLNEGECYPSGCEKREGSTDISWRRNNMDSGSGPVILLPLHRFDADVTGVPTSSEAIVSDHSSVFSSSKLRGPYDHLHTLPANSTQYILQALKPRIIFNAHTGSFSDFLDGDGTREVTVPAMTWKTRGVPGFVITTFDTKGTVTLSCCLLAKGMACNYGILSILVPDSSCS
ncbi:metallophosphoesterase 1-like [Panicum miliaceum]|uniref:Metallophosphoesterase 1-like n=1 Tax=Panicum miliaceum TaxID=4540 RepID=A0A3L6S0Y0_PANMI|nr:metallophosphoesterase 1-like [Panicum miliaceum]